MPLFVVVLLKGTSYHKKTKREAENERSQNGDKKALTAESAPNLRFCTRPKCSPKQNILLSFHSSTMTVPPL